MDGRDEDEPDRASPGEQHAESDDRSGIGGFARGALDLAIELSPVGDIRTLLDPEASKVDQLIAGVSLVGTFIPFAGPIIKAGATALKVGKTARKTEKAADELNAANKTGSKAPRVGDEQPPTADGRPCRGASCSSGKCFAAGTLVHTELGLRPIEEVREGELLWSRDEQTGSVALRPVLQRIVTPDRALLRIELRSAEGVSEELRVTPPHPFWTERGWVAAESLALEERVLLVSGDWAVVAAAEELEQGETVYNFEVDEFHTYFAGSVGVWVHNGGPKEECPAWVQHSRDGPIREYDPAEISGDLAKGSRVETPSGPGRVVSRGEPPNSSDVRHPQGKNGRARDPFHGAKPDVPIGIQLEGTGQIPALQRNPNLKGVNVQRLLDTTPRQLRDTLPPKVYKTVMKHFEGRDLRHGN